MGKPTTSSALIKIIFGELFMNLDTVTIAVISIVIDFALTLILLHAWRTRTTYSGFGLWILSLLSWSIGLIFVLLLFNLQPRFIPKIIGISLILLHPVLIYEGIKRFYNIRMSWWGTPLNLLMLLACLVNQAYFLYIDDNIAMRTAVLNIVLAILFTRIIIEPILYVRTRRHSTQWLLSLAILPLIPTFLLRASQYFKVTVSTSFTLMLNQDILLRGSLLYGIIVEIVIAYAFLSLTSDRVDDELRQSKDNLNDAHESLREALMAVRRSELQYRLLVNNCHGIIYEIRPDGLLGFVSQGWTRVLGHADTEVIGHDFREFVHADDVSACEAFLQRTVSTGEAQLGQVYRVFHVDGRERWHCSNVIPCYNAHHDITSFIGSAVDVTDQVHYEARLNQARMSADAANQAKSEFLALVSHEIRTPLNALVGFSALARISTDPKAVSKYLAILDNSSRSLMELVNNILDISKIEAERMLLLPVPADLRQLMLLIPIPVELRQLVSDLEALYQPRAVEKQLVCSFTVHDSLPAWVSTDPIRLRQILGNLLSNAVKFTETGTIALIVEAAELQQSETFCMVRFTVQDSGVGMSEKKRAQLFRSFQQLDSLVPRAGEGAGLGLSIVRQLCDLMGGSLSVTSIPGEGSSFVVELPLATCPEKLLLPDEDLLPAEITPLEILVADDKDFNRLLLFDTLSGWGHLVTTAESGSRAIIEATRKRFDIILMDLRMPDVDGLEATRKIRAIEWDQGRPATPIIALTADTDSAVAELCNEAGFDRLFLKPTSSESLAAIIAHYGGDAKLAASDGIKSFRRLLNAGTLSDMGSGSPRAAQFCSMLRRDIHEELQLLAAALANESRPAMHDAAHTLKGLCGHLRDPMPAQQASKIQNWSKNVPLDELAAAVALLQDQLRDVYAGYRQEN
ncbi:MAG: ATP-binding protein [Desulfuromonadales bacterium]